MTLAELREACQHRIAEVTSTFFEPHMWRAWLNQAQTEFARETKIIQRRAITTTYIDQYRRGQRWQRVSHLFRPEPIVPDAFGAVEAGSDVADALATLPPRVRACVVLRFFDDLTVHQIGHSLGIAEGTVKRYLSDAMGQLQLALGPLEDAADVTVNEDAGATPRAQERFES